MLRRLGFQGLLCGPSGEEVVLLADPELKR
jgi:hypothetical protein